MWFHRELCLSGLNNKEAALCLRCVLSFVNRLFISVGTVQYRLKKLYSVMGAATRAEFAQMLRLHIAFLDGCEPLPER